MVRLTSLAALLALAPALALGQTTTPPPLNTNTGAGAKTSSTTVIRLTPPGSVTTTSGITGFTLGAGASVSRYPVRVTSNGVVYISTATITYSRTYRPSVTGLPVNTSGTSSTSSEGGTNRGAIAGGVIGGCAVIIAIIATLLWFRRRSPGHWKAKSRGWKNLGGAAGAGSGKPPLLPTTNTSQPDFGNAEPKFPEFQRAPSVTDMQKENPFKDPVESPPPALYIREHRQPVHDPFADPPASPGSPTSPNRPAHHRATSSVNPLLPPNA